MDFFRGAPTTVSAVRNWVDDANSLARLLERENNCKHSWKPLNGALQNTVCCTKCFTWAPKRRPVPLYDPPHN